jgi:phosphodiesterase/alkaline phosphatase D-like protein
MYGTDAKNPSQHAYEPGGATQHRVQLKNLTPGTTYHYEIETGAGKDRFKGSFQTPK